jgi:hypothetical protein
VKISLQHRDAKNLRDYAGFRIWVKPKPTGVYAIGADVAEGIGGDASCAAVLDCSNGVHVASYWSNSSDIDTYAAELYKLGIWYNKAFINVEANNHGNGVIAILGGSAGSLAYSNLYRRIEYNEFTAKRTKIIGFKTGPNSKPRLIGNFKAAMKAGEVTTYDRYTIQELGSFCKDQKTGKLGAKGNAHDDRVMALALAWEQARLIIEGSVATKNSHVSNIKYDTSTGFPISDGSFGGENFVEDEYPF